MTQTQAVQGQATQGQATQRYLTQVARNSYSSLVDTLNAGGRHEEARRCAELAVEQGVWDHPMQRDRDHVPGLRAEPLHDPARFWFTGYLEERFPEIRSEVQGVLSRAAHPVEETIQDHWLLRSGTWQQAYLFREGAWKEDVCAHFPVTRAILSEIPEVTTFSPGVIMVSRLSPGTHITPHCGSTNAVLRVHLGVTVPGGARIRVADRVVEWEEGRCLVFDDSFEHEVWHDGSADRVVLILDMAHPDLDAAHRQRLVDHNPTPEERIVAFMRDRNLAGIQRRDGRIEFAPNPTMRSVVTRYLSATGTRGAELDNDTLHWLPADDDALDGGALDGDALDGGALDGGALDGDALDSAAVDGGAVDSAAVDGGAVDSAAADGGAVDGAAANDPVDKS